MIDFDPWDFEGFTIPFTIGRHHGWVYQSYPGAWRRYVECNVREFERSERDAFEQEAA